MTVISFLLIADLFSENRKNEETDNHDVPGVVDRHKPIWPGCGVEEVQDLRQAVEGMSVQGEAPILYA